MRILAGATTWLRRIVDIALIALIVTVLLVVALGKLVPLTGRQTIVIAGGSMEPAIHLGSAAILVPVDPAGLKAGDVVSMQVTSANAIFTHRVQSVIERPDGIWVQTKGDANGYPDPTIVPASAIIGRVEIAIPFMGYLITLLSLPVGVIFVLGLAATLLAIAWLLESLEPVRTIRVARPGAVGSPGAGRRVVAFAPVRVAPASVTGEPISARTLLAPFAAAWAGAGLAGSGPALLPTAGGTAAQLVAPGTRTALSATPREPIAGVTPTPWDPTALPRPTVREQLARSRDIRSRRARWRWFGSGDDRPVE